MRTAQLEIQIAGSPAKGLTAGFPFYPCRMLRDCCDEADVVVNFWEEFLLMQILGDNRPVTMSLSQRPETWILVSVRSWHFRVFNSQNFWNVYSSQE